MRRVSILIVFLMAGMSLSPTIAQIPAPNDTTTLNGNTTTLSIDGYVTTKIVSVGSDVEIMALTRGHTSSTLVTADIIKYPDIDPIDLITNTALPGPGVVIDTIVLLQAGPHENDSNTMTWDGIYTVPSNSVGGTYGARVIAEDGNLVATDDPTQLPQLLRGEFETVLQAIDHAWDSANPCLEIKGEIDSLETIVEANGNWSTFVAVATEGQGMGGSQQLWDAMIDAGHNQYNMSAGAHFLTALMEFFDSDDVNAGMSFITGLMLYAGEFPIPRTLDDFEDVVDYIQTFDAIENYTRFEGTGDFEAAYNALIGSNEWVSLKQAMDDLANSTKEAEAIQTIVHNFALLTVSGHPDAIIDALEAWMMPLVDGDLTNMTPVQVLLVRWFEMAEELGDTDIIDTNGDDIPDQIIWQYEYLLETSEGQAWTSNMESSSSSSYVNDVLDNFNTLPEDVINDIFDSLEDPVWNATGETLGEFGQWLRNATFGQIDMEWNPDEEEDEEGESSEPESVVFEELWDVKTTLYNSHLLDIGIELRYWGPWNESDYPDQYNMSMTNNHGVTINTVLEQDSDRDVYYGRLTAESIEDAVWTFTQPMDEFNGDMSSMEGAHLEMENMRPSMFESMLYENTDETFIVSALGVIVEQDETTLVSEPYSLSTTSYNYSGPIENAEADIAIFRVSPQLAEEAIGQFSPDGDVEINSASGTLTGQYTESDLSGDVSVVISPYSGHEDEEEKEYPQASSLDYDIEISGSGDSWDASTETTGLTGLVDITTSGTTVDGLEFDIMKQIPLSGTSGCSRTEGHGGGHHVSIGWNYESFRNDDGEFDKPAFSDVEIDWGDFNITSRNDVDGWESHQYYEHDAVQEHTINIHYTDVDGNTVTHSTNFTEDQGFWRDGDDGEGWFEGHFEKGECELIRTQSGMPNAVIIDGFFTNGPMEVMDEQILTTNQSGGAGMTVTPTLPGVYLTVAQTKHTGLDGTTFTGMGMNFALVTEASIAFGGLTEETTLSGIPVYSVQPQSGGLTSISVTPSGVSQSNYNVSMIVTPLEMKLAFPNIDAEDWGEDEEHTLEFQQGDASRTQEVRIKAPISMIGAMILEEDQLFPTAISVGLILNNPGELNITGALGPGQIANIALRNDTAERILAMAAPRNGFDPSTLDLSSVTELFYGEGVREEVGWIPVEQDLEKICEMSSIWRDERWDDGNYSNFRMSLGQEMKYQYVEDLSPWPSYNATNNAVLTEEGEEGPIVIPIRDWALEEWNGRYYADYDLEVGKRYFFKTTTDYETFHEFEVEYDDEGGMFVDDDNSESCSGEEEMSDEDGIEMLDEFLSEFSSVAWGQGSSADLRLPILSPPGDDYTVLAMAKVGEAENATMVSAWGSEITLPNPGPPEMENLTLSFSPSNPLPNDIVQVTATDEGGLPVEGLSFTVVKNNQTLVALISNDYGQVEFAIPNGTIIVRASGGNYYPAELTIIVSDSGSTTGNGTTLPSDTDGDGVDDTVDECPNTMIGATVDEFGCAIVVTPSDSDGDGVNDDVDECPSTPAGTTVDSLGCEIDDGTDTPIMDADGDGIQDLMDTCPDTPEGTTVDFIGCPVTDVPDETDDTNEENTGTASSDDEQPLSMGTIILTIVTGLLLASIGVATLILFRRRQDDGLNFEEDVLFDSPERPSPNVTGEMMDGYEVIEYPQGSNAWWYRDNETGHWMEWT